MKIPFFSSFPSLPPFWPTPACGPAGLAPHLPLSRAGSNPAGPVSRLHPPPSTLLSGPTQRHGPLPLPHFPCLRSLAAQAARRPTAASTLLPLLSPPDDTRAPCPEPPPGGPHPTSTLLQGRYLPHAARSLLTAAWHAAPLPHPARQAELLAAPHAVSRAPVPRARPRMRRQPTLVPCSPPSLPHASPPPHRGRSAAHVPLSNAYKRPLRSPLTPPPTPTLAHSLPGPVFACSRRARRRWSSTAAILRGTAVPPDAGHRQGVRSRPGLPVHSPGPSNRQSQAPCRLLWPPPRLSIAGPQWTASSASRRGPRLACGPDQPEATTWRPQWPRAPPPDSHRRFCRKASGFFVKLTRRPNLKRKICFLYFISEIKF